MGVFGPITTPPATGGAGIATATVNSPGIASGFLMAVFVQYNDAPPVTADIGIRTLGNPGVLPSYNLLTVLNANADSYFSVSTPGKKAADGVDTGQYNSFFVDDSIKVDLAGVNDGDSVSIWLYLL